LTNVRCFKIENTKSTFSSTLAYMLEIVNIKSVKQEVKSI